MKRAAKVADEKSLEKYNLQSCDLLTFSKQIASGMVRPIRLLQSSVPCNKELSLQVFLSSNKIVHRDLAARNVLVCGNMSVKIADFGLSRNIYKDNVYMKSSAGRLPIKWLALESMLRQQYTSQSDV